MYLHEVTAAMLVFQDKTILMRSFCQVHQYGRHRLCCLASQGMSANTVYSISPLIDSSKNSAMSSVSVDVMHFAKINS